MSEHARRPMYWRLLRLRHLHPNSWQRGLLGEGALAVAAILVLADLASAWLLLALPLAVALVVKGHDMLTGLLQRPASVSEPEVAPEQEATVADKPVDGRARVSERNVRRVSPPTG